MELIGLIPIPEAETNPEETSKRITRNEVKDILSKISYKPGFSFKVNFFTDDMVCGIALTAKLPNSCDPALTETSVIANQIWPYDDVVVEHLVDQKYVIEHALDLIKRLEEHEIKEWFKVKGKHFNEPHPPDEPYKTMSSIEEWRNL